MKNGSGVEAERVGGWMPGAADSGLMPKGALAAKRVLDILLAVPLLIFASPLLLTIAILVRMADGGPAIFSHRRCGLNGSTFDCFKFRTMYKDAQDRLQQVLDSDPAAAAEWAEFQKLRNDPRVTPVGRFLRKSSLDELPQLFNILRGEMGVIGPRPVTSQELHRYGANLHFYRAVRPGVLGLWQVNGRNTLTYDQRVAMDIEYVRTWTIWSDLGILIKAVPVVLFGKGAF